jgi:hypothetical protein
LCLIDPRMIHRGYPKKQTAGRNPLCKLGGGTQIRTGGESFAGIQTI